MRIFAFFLIILLSGCATVSAPEWVNAYQSNNWLAYQEQQLQSLDFQLSGRFSFSSEKQAAQGSMEWQQTANDYHILLSSHLGIEKATLFGNENNAQLITKSETFSESTPEALLYTLLGWSAPVSALRYWVLGLPAPEAPYSAKVDHLGQPRLMQQYGWDISFDRFENHYPSRLILQKQDVRLKLIIRSWSMV